MIARLATALDAALLRPERPRTLWIIHTALTAIIGLRLATREWVLIAERPAVFTTRDNVMGWLPAEVVSAPPLIAIQIIGLIGVGLVLARWRAHTGFVIAWCSYLVLTTLWGSSGKVLHNDVLTVTAGIIFLFAAVPDRETPDTPDARWGWPPRAALAVLATVYFFTGFQKLRSSGLEWVFSENMQWVLRQGQSPFGAAFTDFFADHLWLTQMLSGGALLLELTAPILLALYATRILFAVAVAFMHGSIWMFLGLDYSTWVLTVAAVAIPMGLARISRFHQPHRVIQEAVTKKD